MIKVSRLVLAALFTLLFSNLSFAVDVDPCASWPVTLEEDADGFYEIGSADALYKFACMVNNGATNISGKLTADICLNACDENESVLKADGTLSDDASNFAQWTPIGTYEKPYKGTFDGNGHTIRGLYFNDENTNYVGLFGYIDESAIVQNVGVVDSYLKGYLMVGGVVGDNYGGTVSNVYNTGSVSGTHFVGGVVGYNNKGTVSNVYNTGSVSGGFKVGGVVGYNYCGTVSNVYNTGSVSGDSEVGGVVGDNYNGTVSNAYNTGSVSGSGDYVGGVVGDNYNGTVSNGFFNTAYYSGNAIGGGTGTANTVVGKTSTELANLTVGNGGDFPLLKGETKSPWITGSVDVDNAVCKFPYLQVFGEASQPQFNMPKVTIIDIDGGAELGVVAVNPNSKISLADVQVMENGEILSLYKDVEGVPTEWNFENDVVTENVTLKVKYIGVLKGVYQIASAQDLMFFASKVNGGETTASAVLTQDICLNACDENESVLKADGTLSDDASNFATWTPIGTNDNRYTGTFDGKGYTVSGLYFNDENTDYVGLFGYIDESAKVQNVGVVDSYLKGYRYVGGVVGYSFNGTVSNVYNTGSVSGNGIGVGGVVGRNSGTVSNVYNTGSVSGTNYDVGGVIGYNSIGTVSYAYYNTDFYAGNAVGEGNASGENVEGKTTLELASKTLPDGFDENVWVAGSISIGDDGSVTFGLPYLNGQSSQLTFKLEMDVNKYLEISTALQLKLFAQLVNSGETNINGKLTADICLNACKEGDKPLLEQIAGLGENGDISTLGFNQWTPMKVVSGVQVTFNGNGKTISGLYFNDENQDNVGLFGEVYGTVSVSNLGIRDSYFRGESCVGGLVGYNNNGTLTITNSYNAGSVSGRGVYVGGLVGNNNGENVRLTITNSYNAGTVSGSDGSICIGGLVGVNGGKNAKLTITNSYNAGTVSGGDDVGGLVGVNGGEKAMLTITNSYNAGTVSRGDDSYEVGGLVGYNNNGTLIITNSFFLAAGGNGDGLGGELKAFLDDFHNGTVAKELHDWCEKDGDNCKEGGLNGSVWGQDLTNANSLPDFSGVVGFKYGSITFFNLNDDVADSASIDATAKAPVSITSDIVVTGPITFKRPFAVGYSTMMLPFSVSEENKPAELEFYSFDKVEEINGKYTASYISVTGLNAHTPYIVKNSGEDALSQVTFEGEFTLGTSVMPPPNSSSSAWKFNGTYEYKTWEEGDAGLGSTYGFAGSTGNDPDIVGKFAKVGAGAYIYPMRAYLEYTAPAALARPAANGEIRTVASLPDEIEVVIVEKGETGTEIAGSDDASVEQTTRVIGTINTRTGEFKFANDRWFDLQGRYLGVKKPTQKGAYYNNGKKVIVK